MRLRRIAEPATILYLGLAVSHGSNAQLLKFEVASIRPSDPDRPALPFRIGPDSLTTRGDLKSLILLAYEIEDNQVEGVPEWAQSRYYDVQARAETVASPHQIRLMLQALLAERFQLKLHREVRTMSGYVMKVDKGGSKLPPPTGTIPPNGQGVIQIGGGEFWARGATMRNLARALRYELSFPVIDETKIEGNYDFKLRFDEGNRDLAMKPEDGTAVTPGAWGSIFAALRELGLRLDFRKIPIEVTVIDSVERPSEN